MKAKIFGVAVFVLTVATVIFYPALKTSGAITPPPVVQPISPIEPVPSIARPKVEVVFVLDTTGSMGGLIQAAKEKIWSIASTMASAQYAPEIKMGLVAYRDRGDAYVTKVVDLSTDLDSMYATLMDFGADGGGDGPESVNQALYDAIHGISWSQDPNAYRVVFLVGDAPPHMDYRDDVKYPVTLAAAKQKGIVVNTIQCGDMPSTSPQWTRIAALGSGQFFQVEQAGSAVAIATPFDKEMARVSALMDETRMYFGTEEEQERMNSKVKATDKLHAKSSEQARARRAVFNSTVSGKRNFLGNNELIDAVANGRVDLEDLDDDLLPESVRKLSAVEKKDLVAKTAEKRAELQQRLAELSAQRGDYIKEQVEEAGGAEDSLDNKIYSAVRDQAAAAGLVYEDGPEY